jgi:hypothetical protein
MLFPGPTHRQPLLDDGTVEEVRIVARAQHCGIGEREPAKIVFGDEARSERQLTTLRSGVTARAEQKAGLNFLCIREIIQCGQFTRVIVPPPEAPAPLSA